MDEEFSVSVKLLLVSDIVDVAYFLLLFLSILSSFALCAVFGFQDGTQDVYYVRPNESNLLLRHIAQSCGQKSPFFFSSLPLLEQLCSSSCLLCPKALLAQIAASLCQYVEAICMCVIEPPPAPPDQPTATPNLPCTNARTSLLLLITDFYLL